MDINGIPESKWPEVYKEAQAAADAVHTEYSRKAERSTAHYRRAADDAVRAFNAVVERHAAMVGSRVALWDAINRYVRACGGDPDANVYGNVARQQAVADVERLIALDAPPAE